MTNNFTKATILIPKTNFYHLRAALFHATPVLQRKRRSNWDSYNPRSNSYSSRKSRRPNLKQSLLRNARSYADYVFQSWKDGFDEDDPFGSRTASWFKQNHSKGSRRDQTSNQGSKNQHKRTFQFFEDEDDIEVETLFRSAFGGNRFFTWTFIDDEIPRGRCSFSYSNSYKYRKNSRYQHEEYYEFSSDSDSDSSESDLASDRLALGLSASGPLKLEDVKTAYRSCALKWHPDRHDGSSKAIAEEKFKLCSAAYHSLCDKLAAVSLQQKALEFPATVKRGIREVSAMSISVSGAGTQPSTENLMEIGEEKMRPICTLCGRVTYQNPKMVVGYLIEHDNKILLCKRNIQPSHGLWTLPAGYLEIGESAAEGAIRETWEEAEAEVEVVSPFTQLGIPLIGQTYIIFLAKLKKPHFAPGPESSECRLFPLEDIPFDSLAFSSIFLWLQYIEDVKNGKLKFHYGTINKRPGTSAYTLDYHLQS